MSAPIPAPAASPAADPALAAEIARVRDSGVLGGPGRLRELFDFLAARAGDGAAPKEAEIALAVFSKSGGADRDDPVVRVYVHRLRKRLDEYYLRNGQASAVRLDIPKGDYRLVDAARTEPRTAVQTGPAGNGALGAAETLIRRRWPLLAAGAAVALLAINIGGWMLAGSNRDSGEAMRSSPVWSPMTAANRPLLVVVGDYYIFGEYEDRLFLKRLIRDFSINSKDDLTDRYLSDPKAYERYSDVALQYLPASSAVALADLAPILAARPQAKVALASTLTPDKLRDNDILYVGLISGLASLRDPVFARSRYAVGETYDEIIDTGGQGLKYTSEAFTAAPSDTMYRDYGLFSTFAGPAGNRITVLAGTRDTALAGLAEALSRPAQLDAIAKAAGARQDYEMLFEAKGQKNVNLETRILSSGPLDAAAIWAADRAPGVFPDQ